MPKDIGAMTGPLKGGRARITVPSHPHGEKALPPRHDRAVPVLPRRSLAPLTSGADQTVGGTSGSPGGVGAAAGVVGAASASGSGPVISVSAGVIGRGGATLPWPWPSAFMI